MRSVFIMPIFNQVQQLPRLIDELKATDLPCTTLLMVNNGCTDGSAELIHQSGYPYLDLPQNLGIGSGLIRGTEWALERDYDIVGHMAGNGKMLPAEMARVLTPVTEGKADYVTGSRFLTGGDSPNLPSFRQNAIPMVNMFVKVLTGQTVTDATCGYRAYRVDILRRAKFDWQAAWLERYGFEYYVYAKAIMSREWRTIEVPITMRYPPKGEKYSHIKPFSGWWSMLKPWIVARVDGRGFTPAAIGSANESGATADRSLGSAPAASPAPHGAGAGD